MKFPGRKKKYARRHLRTTSSTGCSLQLAAETKLEIMKSKRKRRQQQHSVLCIITCVAYKMNNNIVIAKLQHFGSKLGPWETYASLCGFGAMWNKLEQAVVTKLTIHSNCRHLSQMSRMSRLSATVEMCCITEKGTHLLSYRQRE